MTDSKSGRQIHIDNEELLERTDQVCRVLRAQQTWSRDLADDLFQEVYIALHHARRTFDPERATWRMYSFYKAEKAVKEYFRSVAQPGVEWDRSSNTTRYIYSLDHPDASEVEQFDAGLLSWELEPYTERERKIILLALAGYSYKEMSDLLGIGARYIYPLIANLRIKSSPFSTSLHMDTAPWRQAA